MAFSETPPPPPPTQQPFVNKDGTINAEWHRWLLLFIEWAKRMGAAIP